MGCIRSCCEEVEPAVYEFWATREPVTFQSVAVTKWPEGDLAPAETGGHPQRRYNLSSFADGSMVQSWGPAAPADMQRQSPDQILGSYDLPAFDIGSPGSLRQSRSHAAGETVYCGIGYWDSGPNRRLLSWSGFGQPGNDQDLYSLWAEPAPQQGGTVTKPGSLFAVSAMMPIVRGGIGAMYAMQTDGAYQEQVGFNIVNRWDVGGTSGGVFQTYAGEHPNTHQILQPPSAGPDGTYVLCTRFAGFDVVLERRSLGGSLTWRLEGLDPPEWHDVIAHPVSGCFLIATTQLQLRNAAGGVVWSKLAEDYRLPSGPPVELDFLCNLPGDLALVTNGSEALVIDSFTGNLVDRMLLNSPQVGSVGWEVAAYRGRPEL